MTTPDPKIESSAKDWKRLALGTTLGAFLGAVLAWYANQLRQEEEKEEVGEQTTSLGTGDMVSLGIETLGLVRTLFRMLKRI